MNYKEFIEGKIITTPDAGIQVSVEALHPSNKSHQKDIIQWAAKGGRRAIFASFGLGKSQMQLELSRVIIHHAQQATQAGGKGIIVCPLGVVAEFKRDAGRLGLRVAYCRTMAEVEACPCRVILTNYERVRDGDIDPNYFVFASLDEASVLRSFGSKTYQVFLDLFKNVPFRFVCTATPSPNRYKEIIHYAGFLGVMDTGQALTRWFKRDSTKANNLTLYEHKEAEFWLWVHSWAIFITKPSDLGYSDEGYSLPGLKVNWHRVSLHPKNVQVDRDGQIQAFREDALDLRSASKEKRESISERMEKALEIIDQAPDDHFILWHHLEEERRSIERHFANDPGLASVYGSQTAEEKEALLTAFADGQYRILATKPEIAGQGGNYQYHCHRAIFLGIDHKFNDFIQAIHRIYRFLQQHTCEVDIIYTDAEEHIRKDLEEKWARHDQLVEQMTDIVKRYGLSQAAGLEQLRRTISVTRQVVTGKAFTAVNNDNVSEMKNITDSSVGLIVTSIPFSNHYEYTPSYLDFGHTNNDDHFFRQMDYLTAELHRVLMPGRLACIHVKDRILFGSVTGTGMPTVNPFHAKTIFHYLQHGLAFMGMITIETDVVRENNQTYRLGWTEQCKDGSKMGVGCPEYLLLFRKLPSDTSNAYADEPVVKSKADYSRGKWQIDARAKWNSSGNTLLLPHEITRLTIPQVSDQFAAFFQDTAYDYSMHVHIAKTLEEADRLPATFETLRVPARTEYVWDDVVRMRTLNSQQTQSREQNHICPFQLDIVERAIERWSNPGDLVLDPFGGLMSVPYMAIQAGRRGYGIELNQDYWKHGVRYCRQAEQKASVPTLFDLTNI